MNSKLYFDKPHENPVNPLCNKVSCAGILSHLEGQFVEQKLMLSSNFRCYQIHDCNKNDFGHTLFGYLSPT